MFSDIVLKIQKKIKKIFNCKCNYSQLKENLIVNLQNIFNSIP